VYPLSQRAGRTPLAPLIAELKDAYRAAGLACADGLLPPAPKTELDRLAHELSLALPADLLEVYAVHGGQQHVAPIAGLFGLHSLLTPAEAISQHQLMCEFWSAAADWSRLVPFASWDIYGLYVHATSGEVWEFAEHGAARLACHRPNVAAVLTEMLEAVRAGQEPMLWEYRQPGE
jgi:hypothetical protein